MRTVIKATLLVLVLSLAPFYYAMSPVDVEVPMDAPSPQGATGPAVCPTEGETMALRIDDHFTENLGQMGPGGGSFYALGASASVVLGIGWMAYDVVGEDDEPSGALVRVSFEGARKVEPRGVDPISHRSHFLTGPGEDAWRMGVMSYRQVLYEDLWDGIDTRFHIKDGCVKYDFIVHPGANPGMVRLVYEGATRLMVDEASGDLLVHTVAGVIRDSAPLAFQDGPEGRTIVDSSYRIEDIMGVALDLGAFNRDRPLVIDPELGFGTYIGGLQFERGMSIFVDDAGSSYITGHSGKTGFPTTPGAYDRYNEDSADVIVVKFDTEGDLVYSTYVGGSGYDYGHDIYVDDQGCAFVTGYVDGDYFPTTPGAIDRVCNAYEDAFVFKLNPDGSGLRYSTLFGTKHHQQGFAVCVDDRGYTYVAGTTNDDAFPTTEGAFCRTVHDPVDIFVARLNLDASAFIYSTFIGGDGVDEPRDMYLDDAGNVYLTGRTRSTDFPVTAGAYDRSYNRDWDAFALKLNPHGTYLTYCTYLGGSNEDVGYGISLDDQGCVYIAGTTKGSYPTTPDSFDTGSFWDPVRPEEGFVTKLAADGSDLEYSGYLSSSSVDQLNDIVVDDRGCAYVTGWTYSGKSNYGAFPITPNAFQATPANGSNIVLVKISPDGSSIVYSTYIGGDGNDYSDSIHIDDEYNVYITGYTNSLDFPTTPGAYDRDYNGRFSSDSDAFVIRMDGLDLPEFENDASDEHATPGQVYNFTVGVRHSSPIVEAKVEYYYEDDIDHVNQTMTMTSGPPEGGTWEATIDVPIDGGTPLRYSFYAKGSDGRVGRSLFRPRDVLDIHPPTVRDETEGPPTTGDRFCFVANVTEDRQLRNVKVIYWIGNDTDETLNRSMDYVTGSYHDHSGTWEFKTLELSSRSLAPLSYYFYVRDSSYQWTTTEVRTLQTVDDDPPEIRRDYSDVKATTGDPFRSNLTIRDNIGVRDVHVVYLFGSGGQAENRSMEGLNIQKRGNGTYLFNLTIPSNAQGNLSIQYALSDVFGNWLVTMPTVLDIVDDDPPLILEDLSDSVAIKNELYQFRVRVADNIGFRSVNVSYRFGGPFVSEVMEAEDVQGNGNGTYVLSLLIPPDVYDPLTYEFEIMDIWGNNVRTEFKELEVRAHNIPPAFQEDGTWPEAIKGLDFSFHATVSDDVRPPDVFVEYWLGEGAHENRTMDSGPVPLSLMTSYIYNLNIVVPRDAEGPLHYFFSARDSLGLWASTITESVPVRNAPPVIAGLIIWDIPEESEEVLDITSYVTDKNDPLFSLTVLCAAPNVTVDGFVLRAYFEDWVKEHRVEVSVSDGEDTTFVNITLTVTNVNDPPSEPIIRSPADGSVFELGDFITFKVDFEDPDIPAGQVITITWTSDLAGELRSFTTAEAESLELADLELGVHIITVSVSDGEYNMTASVRITIKSEAEDKGGLGMGAFIGLAIVLVIVAGLAIMMRRRTHIE